MNFLCQRVEQFIVVVHTQNHPSKGEWESVLEAIYSDKLPVLGALVSTEGGSPSAFQRRQLRDALIRHKSEGQFSAVLTHSTIARMAIMALNLSLGNRIKAFPPNAVSEALSYIKAPPSLWSPLAHVLAALQAQLQPRYLLRLR